MLRRLRRPYVLVPLVVLGLVLLGAIASYHDERRGPDARALPGPSLRAAGATGGILVGTALDDGPLQREPGYREMITRTFGAITPENAMKWDALEPERGTLRWAAADRAVDFAQEHGLKVRGHTLVWHAQLPGWLAAGDLPSAELRTVMRTHVRRTLRRYRGQVRTWDVVNEVVDDKGGLRRSVWSDTLGPVFVAQAFAAAREADPDARLAINEIGAESLGPKSDTLLRVVTELRRRGLVDEVGFQAHFNLKGVPATMERNLRRFAATGVDIAITEADVGLPEPAGPEHRRAQATVYRDIVRVCRAVPRCRALTVWGFTDRHSWIPDSQPGFGSATLLDRDFGVKPAYRAFRDALRAP